MIVLNLKNSILLKIILSVMIFVLGGVTLYESYFAIRFIDEYNAPFIDSYTETPEFSHIYTKYLTSAALYVKYKELGYEPDPENLYANFDLDSLYHSSNYFTEDNSIYIQNDFDYYNRLLNKENQNFFYYIKNKKTGDYYFTESMADYIKEKAGLTNDMPLTAKELDEYFKNNTLLSNYLIFSTSNMNYYTDIHLNNYEENYILHSSIYDIIEYLRTTPHLLTESDDIAYDVTENSLPEDDSFMNEYTIYTFYTKDYEVSSADFLSLKNDFQQLKAGFDEAISVLLWAAPSLIICFILLLVLIGHKKNIDGIYLNRFDRIPMEFILLMFGSPFILFFSAYELFYRETTDFFNELVTYSDIPGIAYVLYAVFYITIMASIVTTVKRLKAHSFIHNFLCYKLLWKIYSICKKVIVKCCQTAAVLIKACWGKIHSFSQNMKRIAQNFFLDRATAVQMGIILTAFTLYELIFIALFVDSYYIGYWFFIFIGFFLFILLFIRISGDLNRLREAAGKIASGDLNVKINTKKATLPMRQLSISMNNIGSGLSAAVEDKLKSERLKTELITNVSHDIKTPLTSIISYIDLLKKEELKNDTAMEYLNILDEKSWRLKTLIEDLMEASKASTGNILITLEKLSLTELFKQACGEFEDRFLKRNLELVLNLPEEIKIHADGRSTYRIIENLFSNVYKYSLSGTRIYVDAKKEGNNVVFSIKNISADRLNVNSDDLMERFIRGDVSRNTEGNGLGLSIAKSLTDLQHGSFLLSIDGDLFKVSVTLPLFTGPENLGYLPDLSLNLPENLQ